MIVVSSVWIFTKPYAMSFCTKKVDLWIGGLVDSETVELFDENKFGRTEAEKIFSPNIICSKVLGACEASFNGVLKR